MHAALYRSCARRRASSVKMLKGTQQFGERVNLSMESSDQQVNTQRSCLLAMVKDSDDRMLSKSTVAGAHGARRLSVWLGMAASRVTSLERLRRAWNLAESGEDGTRCSNSVAQE